MMQRISSVDWERDIYGRGQQLNLWPYTEVVSATMRHTRGLDRSELSVLEIGCGAGNNLWFLAQAGFRVAGLDLSSAAIEFADRRLRALGCAPADLRVGDFSKLSWADAHFDLVIDRGALTQVTLAHLDVALAEVLRVLKPGAALLSFYLFGMEHSDRLSGIEVAPGSFDQFESGEFATVGLTSFFDEASIRRSWRNFEIRSIQRHRIESLGTSRIEERYSVHACKPTEEAGNG